MDMFTNAFEKVYHDHNIVRYVLHPSFNLILIHLISVYFILLSISFCYLDVWVYLKSVSSKCYLPPVKYTRDLLCPRGGEGILSFVGIPLALASAWNIVYLLVISLRGETIISKLPEIYYWDILSWEINKFVMCFCLFIYLFSFQDQLRWAGFC